MNILAKFLSVAIAVLLVIGCSPTAQIPESPDVGEVTYACERGGPVLVRFHNGEGLASLVRDEQTYELPKAPAASGFFYSNGKVGIRGKGDELLLEIGRMAPIACHAQSQ